MANLGARRSHGDHNGKGFPVSAAGGVRLQPCTRLSPCRTCCVCRLSGDLDRIVVYRCERELVINRLDNVGSGCGNTVKMEDYMGEVRVISESKGRPWVHRNIYTSREGRFWSRVLFLVTPMVAQPTRKSELQADIRKLWWRANFVFHWSRDRMQG